MRETPKGWAKASLWELVNLRGEKRSPATMPEAQYIGLEHLEPHTSRLLGHVQAGTLKSAGAVFSKGEVLYSRLRPYLNKVWTADRDGLASAEFLVLQSNGSTDMEFIRRRLMTRDFLSFTAGLDKGDRPRVDFEQIGAFQVSLPPLAEQRRIVEKLDALTARTARARADLDSIPVLAARYKQAVLAKAFSGELSNIVFDHHPIRDIITSLDQGWSPKCDQSPASEDQWGVIKTTAIQPMFFAESENKRLPEHLSPRPHIEITAGDVLITRAGPRSRVGIACIVKHSRTRLMLCDKAYRLRVDGRKVDPEFLSFMLNSPQALATIEAMKTGISDSGLNLTQGKFLSLEIPVPALQLQLQLVELIIRAFADIDRMVTEAAAARRLLDRLDQAVLAKAFRGELVPQDPSDEPASALLDRIRAERAAAPTAKRGRRKAAA